jgi:hypothetical protein
VPNHQCMLYAGSPVKYLPGLAAVAKTKLQENWRCLYLNSPPMIDQMHASLAQAGIAVAEEIEQGSLVLSSSQDHLRDGRFDVDRMLSGLADAVGQAVSDGYTGLWATGDMRWEFGRETNFAKLVEYEYALDRFIARQPLSGICQYHIDTLPSDVVQWGLLTHQFLYINEELSQANSHYLPSHLLTYRRPAVSGFQLQEMFARPVEREAANMC